MHTAGSPTQNKKPARQTSAAQNINPVRFPDLHPAMGSAMVSHFTTQFDRPPAMTFSLFGDKFTRHSGITRLMEDLNDGLRTPGAIMLGGGNPANSRDASNFQSLLTDMLAYGKAADALCNYDGPQGKTELLSELAKLLRGKFGISVQNIALTNGSQSAFFYLFNLFAGRRADGTTQKKCYSH